ncbi:MAG: ABC transporter permease [Acidovorax sp. 32-64-7]|nr:MAG: ABC transporter permease [Acidovorax sp. 32-64-7]
MISLAGRDILHAWGKFVFTGIGLGLLIGVTLVMAGVYRGMVDDGKALLDNSGADLWVVQKDTLGPYAEPSSLNDDVYRTVLAMPGVAQAANVTYLTMQARKGDSDVRTMVVGIAPGALGATPGWPPYLVAGRQITRGHYEAVADIATGFQLGDAVKIRRNHYTVVGLTRRMVSSSGDPMVFIPLKDAQEAQFLKDNDAIWQSRRRTEANPVFNRPGVPGLLDAVVASQSTNAFVNAVLVTLKPGQEPEEVAESIRRWKRMTVYTRAQMEGIVAFIIYSLTMDKIREIAVLKLIGTRNRTIAAMILQQALALGVIGFVVGKITATFAAPLFPKYVLLMPADSIVGFFAVLAICVLASIVAIRMALKVDPAEAIGG